jgi:sulfoquinovosyltransferase
MMSVSFDWNLSVLRQLLRNRPNILHVSSPGFYVLGAVVWARCLQIPLLLSYHTHLPVYVRSYLPFGSIAERVTWWLIRLLHSLADVTVVTSTVIEEEFRCHGVPRVHVWPKGVDTQRFHPRFQSATMRERLTGGHPEACLILYVGRIAKEKRLDDLGAILDRLPSNFRVALVGKGPYEESLRERFADSDRVVFMGPLYGDDLSAAYASADVFCFTSDSETLGFVAMEAMASGISVVAARAGGIPDMIENETTGYLRPVGDIDAYVEVIQRLGGDAELRQRISQQARTATEAWTWAKSMLVLRNEMYQKARQNFTNRFEQRLWRLLTFQKRS